MTPTKEQIQQALEWCDKVEQLSRNIYASPEFTAPLPTIRAVLQNAVAGQWQPIETAPASKEVLVLIGIDIFSAYQNTLGQLVSQDPSGGGQCFLYSKPTHWMPLPAPPAQPTTGDGE